MSIVTNQFQAIGVIQPESIKFQPPNIYKRVSSATIVLNGKEYALLPNGFSWEQYKVFHSLQFHLDSKSKMLLAVYPEVIHFPDKNIRHILRFRLVAFTDSSSVPKIVHPVFNDLDINEFRLSGIWQFIPVCRFPVISVYRNFTEERLNAIKSEKDPLKKARLFKTRHLPVLWSSASVDPFRFNRHTPEQSRAPFVCILCKLNTQYDNFTFFKELELAKELPPKYIRIQKEGKRKPKKKITTPLKTTPKPNVNIPKPVKKIKFESR
jgi:hypothetical protein